MKRTKKVEQKHIVSGIVVLVVAGVVYGLATFTSKADSTIIPTPVVVTPIEAPITPPKKELSYTSITIQTDKPGAEIAAVVGLSNVPYVLTLNRLDAKHIQKGVTITIPSELSDWNALSPFPTQLPVATDIPQLLLVSQRIQAVAAYENGTLVRWMPTSTGKKNTPTPSRLYFTNWKGKLVVSTLEGGYILPWAFNLDSMEGIALHQFDLPGYPASHACIRLLEADAMWIYDWAKQWILDASGQNELASGTPVIVFGEYAYGKTAPWKKLATDPNATTLTVDELTEVITAYSEQIQSAATTRAAIENQ